MKSKPIAAMKLFRQTFFVVCVSTALVGCGKTENGAQAPTQEPSPAATSKPTLDELVDGLTGDGGGEVLDTLPKAAPQQAEANTGDGEQQPAQQVKVEEVPQNVKDTPQKKFLVKHPNGKPFKVFLGKQLGPKQLLRHGAYEEYYSNGQVQKKGTYEYGKRTGEWKYWSLGGKLSKRGVYQHDRQDGEWSKFRSDGSLERIERYQNGLAHGQWEAFLKDGKTHVWRREFANGQRHGKWESFHPNGKPFLLETFSENQRHGVSKSWNDAGQLTGQGAFKQGKRDGAFQSFQNGKMEEEETWADGVRKS